MNALEALAVLFTMLAIAGGIAAIGCLLESRRQRHAASCHVVGCAYRSERIRSRSLGHA